MSTKSVAPKGTTSGKPCSSKTSPARLGKSTTKSKPKGGKSNPPSTKNPSTKNPSTKKLSGEKVRVRPSWANLDPEDKGIDIECEPLCCALNLLPSILTVESCCGHGESPFRIWFETCDFHYLPAAVYFFDRCHCGLYGWYVAVTTDCAMSPVCFKITGPVGDYAGANRIAKCIAEYLLEGTGTPENTKIKARELLNRLA